MPATCGLNLLVELFAGRCPLMGCGLKRGESMSTRIRSAHLGGVSVTMIGIDPHKVTHTASLLTITRPCWMSSRFEPRTFRRSVYVIGLVDSRSGSGLSNHGTGSAISSQNSSLLPGETVFDVRSVFASRVRVLGSGRSQRNDQTLPVRLRSRRCARIDWPRSDLMTTPGVASVGEKRHRDVSCGRGSCLHRRSRGWNVSVIRSPTLTTLALRTLAFSATK